MSTMAAVHASPLLRPPTPRWRSQALLAALLLGFAGLLGWSVYVQVINAQFYLDKQHRLNIVGRPALAAQRGRILDRHGETLAQSVPMVSVWADASAVDLQNPQTRAQFAQLAALLDMPADAVLQQVQDKPEATFVWLKRQLDWDVGAHVDALQIPGVHWQKEYRRHYPAGEASAHVLGLTDIDDKGLGGVERIFEQQLTGHGATRYVVKNRLHQAVEGVEGQALDGQDVQLSLDSRVQRRAFDVLKKHVLAHRAQAGSVIVLNARSGEVLALTNYPSYTPAPHERPTQEQRFNRAVSATFDPGSVIKPFTVALALEQGQVTPYTPIATSPGRLQVGRAPPITDIRNYGTLTVAGVIQKSSNVGSAKIGLQLSAQSLWDLYARLGFGQRPPIEIAAARAGIVNPLEKWTLVDHSRMSFGYGLSVSLLHMARSYTVFANDGRILPLTILKPAQGSAAPAGEVVFSPQTASAMRDMLALTTAPGGTGTRAQVPGYSVGGKSGTARKMEGRHYLEGKYRASFIGMAPMGAPNIIVAAMIDEPSAGEIYGGAVAAPVVREVLEYALNTLGVPPDMPLKPR